MQGLDLMDSGGFDSSDWDQRLPPPAAKAAVQTLTVVIVSPEQAGTDPVELHLLAPPIAFLLACKLYIAMMSEVFFFTLNGVINDKFMHISSGSACLSVQASTLDEVRANIFSLAAKKRCK